jgi:signal transduction histidine kinase
MSISAHTGNLSPGRLKHSISDAGLPVKSFTAPDRDEGFSLQLWERANLIRSFVWNYEGDDEAVLLRELVTRVQEAFSIDFCLSALRARAGDTIQAAAPEVLLGRVPTAFVGQSMELIANSRMPVKWMRPEAQTGFRGLLIMPFPTGEGWPLGFLMLAHSTRRNFTRAELLLMQALTSDVGWAIRELRCKRTQDQLLSRASVELTNALELVRGGLWRDSDGLSKEERVISRIEANIQETLRLITGLSRVPGVGNAPSTDSRQGIDLGSAIEAVLTTCRHQALAAGIEFVALFSGDLPRAFVTEPALFDRVLRNLAEYAIEVSDRGRVLISAARIADAVELILQITDVRHDRQVGRHGTKPQGGNLRCDRLAAIREDLKILNGRLGFVKRLGEGVEISVRFALEGN